MNMNKKSKLPAVKNESISEIKIQRKKWDGKPNKELIKIKKEIEGSLTDLLKKNPSLNPNRKEILSALNIFQNKFYFSKTFDSWQPNMTKARNEILELKAFIECATGENIKSIKFTGIKNSEVTNDFLKNHIISIIKNDEYLKECFEKNKAKVEVRKPNPSSSDLKKFVWVLFEFINDAEEYAGIKEISTKKCKLIMELLSCIGFECEYTYINKLLKAGKP